MFRKAAKAVVLSAIILASICLPALGSGMDAQAAEAGYGEVTFKFYVDNSLRGKEMEMRFYNTETMEFVNITTDEFKADDLTTEMPVGTYELSAIYYDGDWNFNYTSSITCGTFTVTEDGVVGDNVKDGVIYVITDLRVTTNASVQAVFSVSGCTDEFDGTIQVSTHGETDAYYATDRQDLLQQEEYTFVIEGEKTASIDAGSHTITEINAYDSSFGPLNIYYPEVLELNRYEDLESGKEFVFYVYDDEALEALTPAEKKAFEDGGYLLKTSDEMAAFEWKYDDKAVLSYDKATGTGGSLGIIEGQDALGLEAEDFSMDEEELEGDAGDGIDTLSAGEDETEAADAAMGRSRGKAAVLVIVFAGAAAFCVYLAKRE
ncbi:MAG: hypothetical protein LUE14_04605 [Clostridiales bacterium]|nr:hypothetical protein [Clostridiales bacterium]